MTTCNWHWTTCSGHNQWIYDGLHARGGGGERVVSPPGTSPNTINTEAEGWAVLGRIVTWSKIIRNQLLPHIYICTIPLKGYHLCYTRRRALAGNKKQLNGTIMGWPIRFIDDWLISLMEDIFYIGPLCSLSSYIN